MPHGYLPDLNAEYDYTTDSLGTFIEAKIRIEAEEFFNEHWPTSLLIEDYHQWRCSNCDGIFKQDSEPEISYCPWCGRKFVKNMFLRKTFILPKEATVYKISPKDICQAKHGVGSCMECGDCKDCRDA